MELYELVTPSDAITFRAKDDKTAFMAAVLLGNGKAGCHKENGENIPSMMMFSRQPDKDITDYLAMPGNDWVNQNSDHLSQSLLTFQYTSLSERKDYEDQLAALPDDQKQSFAAKWEDDHRSSMSQWVLSAWKYGHHLAKKPTPETEEE